jgi:hypothetical protein
MAHLITAFPEHAWILVLIGLTAGILSALLGVGSGILVVPALVVGFGLAQKSAQGVALAVMVPMALVGTIRYMTTPDIDIHLGWVLLLALGGVAGALVGASVMARLPGDLLRKLFALFLIVVAIHMLVRPAGRSAPPDEPARPALPGEG